MSRLPAMNSRLCWSRRSDARRSSWMPRTMNKTPAAMMTMPIIRSAARLLSFGGFIDRPHGTEDSALAIVTLFDSGCTSFHLLADRRAGWLYNQSGVLASRDTLMSVTIACASCRRPLVLPVTAVGQQLQCPACRATFTTEARQPRADDFLAPL